jgi:metal-responsive CopG/Arc/MetJ family transcriptional regulator
MIAEIDDAVGNDKGGRSGLVRAAVRSYLDQLRQHGTEAA